MRLDKWETEVIRQTDLNKWLHALGFIPDLEAGTCWRIADKLRQLQAEGRVEKVAEGRYKLTSQPSSEPPSPTL